MPSIAHAEQYEDGDVQCPWLLHQYCCQDTFNSLLNNHVHVKYCICKDYNAGMLTIFVKVLSVPITILWQKILPIPILLLKTIANTNTLVTILLPAYYIQQCSFFPQSCINEVNRMIVVEIMAKSV